MARILLGVSGGIAAYKAVELARLAIKARHAVRVVMTESATRFVGEATFEGITGAKVLVGEFEADPLRGSWPGDRVRAHQPIPHLSLAENADVMLVAPASANTIAKLAHGFCDSALTTTFCATRAPRVLAPAMNDAMWQDAATAANIDILRARGVNVVDPGEGSLASIGEHGVGRLAEPTDLLAAIQQALGQRRAGDDPSGVEMGNDRRPLIGRKVLVTAGGTREPLDPVRYLGNRSSGKMGLAIAEAARDLGAEVVLIAANVGLPNPSGIRVLDVESTDELAQACHREFADSAFLFMAAAPADFRPVSTSEDKLVRGNGTLALELESTPDILAALAEDRADDQVLVGFAAETGPEGLERARSKRERKGLDLIVHNDVSDPEIGFDSDQNAVTVIGEKDTRAIGPASKRAIADVLVSIALAFDPSGRD